MENGTRRLLYTASFYVHRKNAKQACTSAHTSRVRVHTRGRMYGGVTAEGRHAGFVYPLARPCVISRGSILSTGTQFSRAAVQFRFPAFARPSCTPISQFPSPHLATVRVSFSSSFSPNLRLIRAIHLSPSSRASPPASVILYTFRSSHPADQFSE